MLAVDAAAADRLVKKGSHGMSCTKCQGRGCLQPDSSKPWDIRSCDCRNGKLHHIAQLKLQREILLREAAAVAKEIQTVDNDLKGITV